MSHFAVLVLHEEGQDIEELLAPYSKNLKVEPHLKYSHDKALEVAEKEFNRWNEFAKEKKLHGDEPLEWFVKQCSSYSLVNGDIYTTYNENSKWDWWEIGGRFSGGLRLTDEGLNNKYKEEDGWSSPTEYDKEWYRKVSSAPVKDIEWIVPLTPEEVAKAYKWWMANIEQHEEFSDDKDEFFFWNPEWYKERYSDFYTYVKLQELPCYHAVVTPDGIWHEESEMGWFACTDGDPKDELKWDLEFYDTFIKPNLDSDLVATVVDCHI